MIRELGLDLAQLVSIVLICLVIATVIANLISGGIHDALNTPNHRRSSVHTVKKPKQGSRNAGT